MTTATKANVTALIDGEWVEVSRREEAEEFALLQNLLDYERELFPAWYAKQRNYWSSPQSHPANPFKHVGAAYYAWLRRP
jgi:hypothetical protein